MQWEFRKALETFEGYKRSATFKNEIENGDEGTLDLVLREVELILADKNEKIITKVLALRVINYRCSLSETSWCLGRKMLLSELKNLSLN